MSSSLSIIKKANKNDDFEIDEENFNTNFDDFFSDLLSNLTTEIDGEFDESNEDYLNNESIKAKINSIPSINSNSSIGGTSQKGGTLEEKIEKIPDIFLTMISSTDSLLSNELDPKKILCNIHDWVMLGTINTEFSKLLFTSVEKLLKIHIKKEQEKNPSFNSTILLTYLTALQSRLEAVFLDPDIISETANMPYTDLLRKLFGDEVAQQLKTETNTATGLKEAVLDKKTGYTKKEALSVRDKFIAALANKSQCVASIGNWESIQDIKCWIVDKKLASYAAHQKFDKLTGKIDYCPADPGVDCEHMGGLRFQLIHANVVQTGIKRFKQNTQEYQDYIRMFYDWSLHGPNVIKNDEEWMEFDENTGFFKIAMVPGSSKKFLFENTLHEILMDAKNLKNRYGSACIDMKIVPPSKDKLAQLDDITQPGNVERIKLRLKEIIDKMNKDLEEFYKCLPCTCTVNTIENTTPRPRPINESPSPINESPSPRNETPRNETPRNESPRNETPRNAIAKGSNGLTPAQKKISTATRVYYYMCIFKFLSNIPTLEFINMVTHTAEMKNNIVKRGGSQKGGQSLEIALRQIISSPSDTQVSNIYYNIEGKQYSAVINLLKEREETSKTLNTLLYLYETPLEEIMTDTQDTKVRLGIEEAPSQEPDNSRIEDQTPFNVNAVNPLTKFLRLLEYRPDTTSTATSTAITIANSLPNNISNVIEKYNPQISSDYSTTIKKYTDYKNLLIKTLLDDSKSEEFTSHKRIIKPSIKKIDNQNYYFDYRIGNIPYQILINIDLRNYRSSKEEDILGLPYKVTIYKQIQSGKTKYEQVRTYESHIELDPESQKNAIMVEFNGQTFFWTLEELKVKTLGKGGTKNKNKKIRIKNKTKKQIFLN